MQFTTLRYWHRLSSLCPSTLFSAAERDELRASMQELLGRLSAANSVISQADDSMQAMAVQLEEAQAARRRVEEEAAVARQEAEGLREAVSDLQVGRGGTAAWGGIGNVLSLSGPPLP